MRRHRPICAGRWSAEVTTPCPDARALRFLDRLADPQRPVLQEPVAIVLAHPDDESIGLGGQIDRLKDRDLVIVTDGAPRRLGDAAALGFRDEEAYAEARRAELLAALAIAGVEDRPTLLGIPDQEVIGHLDQLIARLMPVLARAEIVLTHAYEGGHPDHDGVAFAVHRTVGRLGAAAPAIVELPLYRAGNKGSWLMQSFDDTAAGTVVPLGPDVLQRKRRMLAAHRSQKQVIALFDPAVERFRPAPPHDFTRLPNGGHLLYRDLGWLSAEAWQAAVEGELDRCV